MKRSVILTAAVALGLLSGSIVLFWPKNGPGLAMKEEPVSREQDAMATSPQEPPLTAPVQTIESGKPAGPSAASEAARPAQESLLATAVGKAQQQHFHTRLAAIDQLGSHLTAGERQALYAYLRDPAEESQLRPGQSFALKNDVLNLLREQAIPPPELTDVLIELFRDASQPLVMRDYALQHLAPWYAKAGPAGGERIVAELQTAASEISRSYAGTALIGWHRIRQENPRAELPPLTQEVLHVVEAESANLLARIAAVQLTGELAIEQGREAVRRIAADASQPPTLRMAAIGALGKAGTEQDGALLARLAVEPDERLQQAAAAALHRP